MQKIGGSGGVTEGGIIYRKDWWDKYLFNLFIPYCYANAGKEIFMVERRNYWW